MSNRFGQAYGLTLFSPILGGADSRGVSHDTALRRELLELSDAPEGPFVVVPTTHLARWVVIDDASYEGIPAKVDHFASKYLLFTSCFDAGTKDDETALVEYLELMRTNIGATIDRLYRHCVGYKGVNNAEDFRSYVKACQVETTFFFGAYPKASVDAVLRALDAQRRMGDFVVATQASRPTPDQLKQRFTAFLADLASAPTPRPGTI